MQCLEPIKLVSKGCLIAFEIGQQGEYWVWNSSVGVSFGHQSV